MLLEVLHPFSDILTSIGATSDPSAAKPESERICEILGSIGRHGCLPPYSSRRRSGSRYRTHNFAQPMPTPLSSSTPPNTHRTASLLAASAAPPGPRRRPA